MISLLEEYCGNYEEMAEAITEDFGGANGHLSYPEFSDFIDSLEGGDELDKEVKQLLFHEVANYDGKVEKEDLEQFANEIN